MKAKLISAWKTITAFVKRNAFSCACFLLALLVFVTGSVSYAKYVTGSSGGGSASAGTFSVSATIDSVSALSFTNTSFWGSGTDEEDDKVQMNVLRSVNFSVRNYNEDNETNVSATRLKYNLAFTTPKNFAEKLALQVFDEKNQPMLPQIVIADLINAGDTGGAYNTKDSNNYSGIDYPELTFNVTKSGDDYVATSGNTVIQLQKVTKQMEQSLMFRMWDTSKLTSESNPTMDVEGGQLQTPLTVTYKTDVDCYRIVVTMGDFVLPAGERKEVKHSIRLAPTDSINDDYIGSTIVEKKDDGTYQPITQIYADNGTTYYLQNVWKTATDTYYTDKECTTPSSKPSTSSTTNVSHLIDYKEGDTSTTTTKTNEQVNETVTTPHTYTTTTTTEVNYNDIVWLKNSDGLSTFNINNKEYPSYKEPTKQNYDDNQLDQLVGYVGSTYRVDSPLGTKFYIYKIPVTRTGTVEVEEVSVTKEISSRTTTDRSTETTEEQKVIAVNKYGTTETITMNVVRTTAITDVGNENVIKTTTTTKTYARTYTETGWIYRAYYLKDPKSSNPTFTYVELSDFDYKNIIYKNDISDSDKIDDSVYDKDTNKFSSEKLIGKEGVDYTSSYTDGESTTTTTNIDDTTPTDQSFSETKITIEYLTRTIERKYTYTEIIPTKVNWCELDKDRKLVTDDKGTVQMIDYTTTSPLKFYYTNENGTQIQYLYLAQCYSKEYPFFVDVVFEQIQ